MKNKEHEWFVEYLDNFTRLSICRDFNIGQNSDRLTTDATVFMSDGKERKVNLIKISLGQKDALIKYANENQLQFFLYERKGDGNIQWIPKRLTKKRPARTQTFEGVSFDKVR